MKTNLCTIGFSKKPLRKFVGLLQQADVTRLIDTRLNNTSQLSGYAKKADLEFIMNLVGIGYVHDQSLAPTDDILKAYKKKEMSWDEYEKRYIDLLSKRKVENRIDEILEDEVTCFLCSEDKPHNCHRRLLAEYLREHKQNIGIVHLF
jgi:uncharacterized protein (DUF488 family)